MSSLTTTWSPSSFQLRLAFTGRKSPSVVLFHTRFRKLDWRIRLFSVSENISVRNDGSERRPSGDSWAVNSYSAADGFAGWTNGEQSSDSHPKPSLKGIAGAGVAGVVLVAGLTFAALSLGKRNTSRVKQQMEPLTAQQELQLASEENINESKSGTQEDIDKDVSSSTENTEVTESRNDMADTSNVDDAPNVAPLQQDAQNESSNDDTLVDPEESPKPPEAEISAGSFTASSSENNSVNLNPQQLEPLSEVTPQQENLVTKSSLLDSNMTNVSTNDQEGTSAIETTENPNYSPESSQSESTTLNILLNPQLGGVLEPRTVHDIAMVTRSSPATEDVDLNNAQEASAEGDKSSPALLNRTVIESFGARLMSDVAYPFANEQLGNAYQTVTQSRSPFDLTGLGITFTSSGTPAPSNVSTALQEVPGKVLVPAVVDHVQGQALAALQALKVIEADVQPGDLCTRREYARWLVSASSALSRSSASKVYPAMYIENVTELAFDDITAEDPDFPSIQGLAEAGLISSKLSRRDMQCSVDDDPCPVLFTPESPLSRQDLVSWKMALEKKQLPVVDRKTLQQLSGFIDIQRINPDAWPALVADLAAGEQGIIALSFGYTRLFQPDKPVTKAQAAIALATGEASEIVSEELARIEAETMAEKVVASQSALVAQFEQDVNASYEKELQLEREKIGVVEKLAVEARQELEKLRAQREEENFTLMKERAAIDSEMEVLSRLRIEVEKQLQTLLSNKVEISYEKERISKLRTDAEAENQEITQLHYELEVERKALSMARTWAEDEAKRAREQAKSLEEARERWERQGIKVVVDDDLREEANAGVTWVAAGKEFSEGTVDRAEYLVDRLKAMADVVRGKSRDTIQKIVQMVLSVVHSLKELILKAGRQGEVLKDTTIAKLGSSVQEAQQSSVQFTSGVKEGIKRVAGDCREGIEKITQRFKT